MKGENFIYFGAVSGFFIGVIYGVLADLDVMEFLAVVAFMSGLFYIFGLASVAFFIKFIEVKQKEFFNKTRIDEILEVQIQELEKKENFILENYEFIKQIEEDELNLIKNKRK